MLHIVFIDSTRFMSNSLSNFVNNLSEGIDRIKCKFGLDDNKCETCGIKYKYCNCFLKYSHLAIRHRAEVVTTSLCKP